MEFKITASRAAEWPLPAASHSSSPPHPIFSKAGGRLKGLLRTWPFRLAQYCLSAIILEEIAVSHNHLLVRMALVATVLCCAAGSAGAQASFDAMLTPELYAKFAAPKRGGKGRR
jgi:hypothetical protein